MARMLAALFALAAGGALAHGGGLNAEGCHHERRTGGYHCHRAQVAPVPQRRKEGERPAPQPQQRRNAAAPAPEPAKPTCYTGPRGGRYTITPSGRKNYKGC